MVIKNNYGCNKFKGTYSPLCRQGVAHCVGQKEVIVSFSTQEYKCVLESYQEESTLSIGEGRGERVSTLLVTHYQN